MDLFVIRVLNAWRKDSEKTPRPEIRFRAGWRMNGRQWHRSSLRRLRILAPWRGALPEFTQRRKGCAKNAKECITSNEGSHALQHHLRVVGECERERSSNDRVVQRVLGSNLHESALIASDD